MDSINSRLETHTTPPLVIRTFKARNLEFVSLPILTNDKIPPVKREHLHKKLCTNEERGLPKRTWTILLDGNQ